MWVMPVVIFCSRSFLKQYNRLGLGKVLVFSVCLCISIFCLRYAVGYYAIISAEDSVGQLTFFEEIFNSFVHSLQTFSMDEDYTFYLVQGKQMMSDLAGEKSIWVTIYGFYVSVLNLIAPIIGGAIIFEILASIFPKIKLCILHLAVWKEKFYFSELNEASLALAKSIVESEKHVHRRPVIIFTDTYIDEKDEKSSEVLTEAKQLGAICIRDDLSYVIKNKYGKRSFFLIDEKTPGNLQALAALAEAPNYLYLKNTEVYLFTDDDSYVQVENRVWDKLKNELGFKEEELPVFVPIQSYRNLISNLLVEIPLYEPLIHKMKNADGTRELKVTILGTGQIGTEMFLASYWFGQILDCRLTIRVVAKESEEAFWNKIDYINPEIRHTTIEGHPILQVNRRGEMAEPYCKVEYVSCDVKSSKFVTELMNASKENNLLDTDYFLVAIGSDVENLSVANTVKKHIGEYHLTTKELMRTVISYVVFDSELTNTLNRTKRFRSDGNHVDIYMRAIGSLQEVYSARNVFMTEQEPLALKAHEAYLATQNRAERAQIHKKRIKDDYNYWASLARGMHIKYKVFSMGLLSMSLFDVDSSSDSEYEKTIKETYSQYKKIITGKRSLQNAEEKEQHQTMLHKLAWLEHRRWNAFTRVKGFRHTSDYDVYAVAGENGSYKHMGLKLHPCLVECDKRGIRSAIVEKGEIDKDTRLEFDLLDELSYDLYEKKYNNYDFKQYDYPISDF